MKLRFLLSVLAVALLGCGTMGEISAKDEGPVRIRFKEHGLGVLFFSCRDAEVRYSWFRDSGGSSLIRPKRPEDDRQLGSPALGFTAFEGPLKVQWKSANGTPHSAVLNLDEIFKGRAIEYTENAAAINPDVPFPVAPLLIVEINDTTLTLKVISHPRLKELLPSGWPKGITHEQVVFQKTFG